MAINLPCGNKPLTTNECGGDCDEKIERLAERVSEAEEKLDTIQEGAEVNVNADWEETDPNSDAYIENKPSVNYDLSLGDSAPTVGSAVVGSAVLGSLVDIILGRGDGTEDRVSVSGTGAIQITRDGDTMTIHVPVGEIDQLRNGTDTEARAWAANVLKQWLDERIAQIPADQFLDLNKTVFANPFTWSSVQYPGSVNPNLDGKPVLVLALTDGTDVSYSFLNMEDLIDIYTGTSPISVSGNVISHDNSGVTAGSYGDASNQTPNFGDTFKALRSSVDAKGHVTSMSEHTVKIPDTLATQESAGLMSAEDKEKLDNVDQLYKTTCGNPIVVDDADGEVKSLNVELTPIQDLHGYDKPWAAGAGKNKLLIENGTRTVSGITFTQNADGSIIANGTATEAVIYAIKPFAEVAYSFLSDIWDVKADTQYVLTGTPTGHEYPNCYLQLLVYGSGAEPYDAGSGSSPFSFTQEVIDTKRYRLAIRVASGYTLNNVVFKPMIRLATETDSSWTPYENICPISPHTSLPVRDTGKNLLSPHLYTGVEYNPNVGDTVTLADNPTQFSTSDNKTYTLTTSMAWRYYDLILPVDSSLSYWRKMAVSSTGTMGVTDGFLDANYTILSKHNNTATSITINSALTIPSGAKYFYIVLTNRMTAEVTITLTEPQIEHGTTATSYAPYTGQTVTVPLNDLYGGTVDVIGGQSKGTWTMLSPITVLGLGSTNVTGEMRARISATGIKSVPVTSAGAILCNALPTLTANQTYMDNEGVSCGDTTDFLYLNVQGVNTKADYEQWIADNNIQLCYELATPTPLTTTPTPLTLYKGDNVISSDGDMCITYLQDRGDLTDLLNEVRNMHEEVQVTLDADEWTETGTQAVMITGLEPDDSVIVTPAPSDLITYVNAGVVCISQGTDSLTFQANTPVTVNVNILIAR